MIQRVHDHAKDYDRVLVCLDSNHTHDHVLAELNAYAGLAHDHGQLLPCLRHHH